MGENTSKVETLKFYGFRDREMTFKYIKRLWSNVSPYAEDNSSSGSDEEEEDGTIN